MSFREPCHKRSSKLDDNCASKPPETGDKLADALQSQLIDAFEAAIYQGMRPMDALSVVLSWMSSEMARIQAEQTNRSTW